MVRLSLPRRIAALGVAAVLTASWAAAAPPAPRTSLWAQLWTLFGLPETLDNGCHVDPSGFCATGAASTGSLDNGCHADPNGFCATGAAPTGSLDNGCHLDPSGRCATGSLDNGCHLDPNGACPGGS